LLNPILSTILLDPMRHRKSIIVVKKIHSPATSPCLVGSLSKPAFLPKRLLKALEKVLNIFFKIQVSLFIDVVR